ncbi:MAG: MogA/MoaB family molybdenum cofactor biosynthesis protein [Actinomycetota bacterium]|nr:MogA/MoaB family molybdenum cofactor biosynthesis protein [Actinomycetota bacterium]
MSRAVVITVSTRAAAGVYADEAGPLVATVLREAGFDVVEPVVVPDGRQVVADAIREACERADVVVTTGGTGLHPRDETPEATLDVVDRLAPGLAEAMRAASLAATPMSMLSRAVAGLAGHTLVINLPGSPKGAQENLHAVVAVLGHAVDQLRGGDHRG